MSQNQYNCSVDPLISEWSWCNNQESTFCSVCACDRMRYNYCIIIVFWLFCTWMLFYHDSRSRTNKSWLLAGLFVWMWGERQCPSWKTHMHTHPHTHTHTQSVEFLSNSVGLVFLSGIMHTHTHAHTQSTHHSRWEIRWVYPRVQYISICAVFQISQRVQVFKLVLVASRQYWHIWPWKLLMSDVQFQEGRERAPPPLPNTRIHKINRESGKFSNVF
jgi:hypothetical protein